MRSTLGCLVRREGIGGTSRNLASLLTDHARYPITVRRRSAERFDFLAHELPYTFTRNNSTSGTNAPSRSRSLGGSWIRPRRGECSRWGTSSVTTGSRDTTSSTATRQSAGSTRTSSSSRQTSPTTPSSRSRRSSMSGWPVARVARVARARHRRIRQSAKARRSAGSGSAVDPARLQRRVGRGARQRTGAHARPDGAATHGR